MHGGDDRLQVAGNMGLAAAEGGKPEASEAPLQLPQVVLPDGPVVHHIARTVAMPFVDVSACDNAAINSSRSFRNRASRSAIGHPLHGRGE